MARLESEAKGGYYPTPPIEMDYILKRIQANPNEEISILDPCAGKGQALKQIKEHFFEQESLPKTYGIEIEKSRTTEARKNIDVFENCGYEEIRMSHHSVSLLYLNPPFMQIKGERAETTFFRDLTMPDSYLFTGSLVILNIPQHVLADVAKLIATRLEQVKVYRFSDLNFSTFNQVIVMGYRRASGQGRDKALEEKLLYLSSTDPKRIPSLDEPDWYETFYMVKKQVKPIDIFMSNRVDPEEIIESEKTIFFMEKLFSKLGETRLESSNLRRPAMPLKITHQVQAIQSGALPEHMGDHLLLAKDESVQTKEVEVDPESGKTKITEMYKRKSIIRVFTQTGHIDLK